MTMRPRDKARRNEKRAERRDARSAATTTSTATDERAALAMSYDEKMETRIARAPVAVPPAGEPVIGERVTSPELASLAAKYINFSTDDIPGYLYTADARIAFAQDVRRLAASVLSQAERADG